MTSEPMNSNRSLSIRHRRSSRSRANICLAGACIAAASITAGLVMLMEPAEFDRLAHRWPLSAGLAMIPAQPSPVPVFTQVLARMETHQLIPSEAEDRATGPTGATPPSSPHDERLAAAPTAQQSIYLVRATLIALDHANRTGNYSVLRELASTNFQLRNGADQLSEVFAGMRHSQVDLTAAALQHPRWLAPPALMPDNRLVLRGTMPALPTPVAFNVHFSIERGIWKLDAIDISPAETQTAANG